MTRIASRMIVDNHVRTGRGNRIRRSGTAGRDRRKQGLVAVFHPHPVMDLEYPIIMFLAASELHRDW